MNARTRLSKLYSHLTVRGVPPRLARALEAERRRCGRSLNQTVLDLLGRALGVGTTEVRSNGLRALAGTWSAAEQARFDKAITFTEQIDPELWR
ncbi:hypothetical protein L6Q96_22455 [Candidatus Binatia bacterium]|nr:hypothetical protein [Candidatus Binatia bacterium]